LEFITHDGGEHAEDVGAECTAQEMTTDDVTTSKPRGGTQPGTPPRRSVSCVRGARSGGAPSERRSSVVQRSTL
jgi:hypothetical protein